MCWYRPEWRSLRLRLLAWLGAIALVVMGVTWLLHGMLLQDLARDFLSNRLRQEANYTIERLRSGGTIETSAVQDGKPDFEIFHHLYALQVDGSVSTSQPTLARALKPYLSGPDETAVDIQWHDMHLLVWRENFMLNGFSATLLIGEDFAQVERGLSELHWWIGGIAATVLILLLALNLLAVNRALRPFARLREQLTALQSGQRQRLQVETVSELDALIVQLNTFLNDQERRQQRSRESLANLSHALKTPLAAVIQSMRSRRALTEQRREQILARLHDIDEKLASELRRSRIAGPYTGQRHVTRAEVDELCEMFRVLYPERQFHVETTADNNSTLPVARQDFMEMLGIVLDNAGQWSYRHVRLQLAASPPGLCVEDDGPGVADEQLKQLGQRGLRLDERRHGHGLGLSILMQLVEQYRGRLAFDHASLGGLRVCITFDADTSHQYPSR